MKKIKCPICGKELVALNDEFGYYEFWCDDCDIDITVEVHKTPDTQCIHNYFT